MAESSDARKGLVEGLEEANRIEKELDAADVAEDEQRAEEIVQRIARRDQQGGE